MFLRVCLLGLLWLGLAPTPALAQFGGGGAERGYTGEGVKFAAIPIPNYNETFGFGLGLLGSAFYRTSQADTVSPPSSTSLFGFYTSNETWVAGFAQSLYLSQDKYRGNLYLGLAGVNFQFYATPIEGLPGGFIPFNTQGFFGGVDGAIETLDRLYLGVQYEYFRLGTEFDVALPDSLRTIRETLTGPGVLISYDTRNNIFNPDAGLFLDLSSSFYLKSVGSTNDFSKFKIPLNAYVPINESSVIATRAYAEIATGDVPFQGQSVVGRSDLRGYTSGRYRADQVYAFQAEWRWRFYKRLGSVAFAGVGWATDTLSETRFDDALPCAGVGLRFRMIEDYRINAGVDFAVGKDDTAFYFRIGEAF